MDSDCDNLNETIELNAMIAEKVNSVIDTIVDKVRKNLDENIYKMVVSHNKKKGQHSSNSRKDKSDKTAERKMIQQTLRPRQHN